MEHNKNNLTVLLLISILFFTGCDHIPPSLAKAENIGSDLAPEPEPEPELDKNQIDPFNFVSITPDQTDILNRRVILSWDGIAKGNTYIACKVDINMPNDCSPLGEVKNENNIMLAMNDIVHLHTVNFFILGKNGTASYKSTQRTLTTQDINEFILRMVPDVARENDYFGQGVAISDDGKTMGISANRIEHQDGELKDGVYIYKLIDNTWQRSSTITMDSPVGSLDVRYPYPYTYGYSHKLSFNKNGSVLVMGIYTEDEALLGRVSVFRQTEEIWKKETNLTVEGIVGTDYFSSAVSMSNDGMTVVVGASGKNAVGAAYVFEYQQSQWTLTSTLTPFNGADRDFFGISVAVNADGSVIVIGAADDDSNSVDNPNNNGEMDTGAAHVFEKKQNIWQRSAYIKSDQPQALDRLGSSISISNDGKTIAIGADRAQNQSMSESEIGKAFIFEKQGTTWVQRLMFYPTYQEITSQMNMGSFIDISGDGNTVAVGAIRDESDTSGINSIPSRTSVNDSGAVYVLRKSANGEWDNSVFVKAAITKNAAHFSSSMAINHDGSTLVISAPKADGFKGEVYVY